MKCNMLRVHKTKKICLLGLLHYIFMNSRKNRIKKAAKRRWWVRDIFQVRKTQGDYHALLQEMKLFDTEKYLNYLRLTPQQFESLLAVVGLEIQRIHFKREPIGAAERLALTLRYLASGNSMVSMSYAFRLGKQTVSDIIRETCEALWNSLNNIVFQEPKESNWLTYASEFGTFWQLRHGIGAIDGKHVIIQAPPHSGSQFYNYKGNHSIVLMALCSANYKFIFVDIGAQGRQSDGGIFRNSEIGLLLLHKELSLPPPSPIEDGGDALPYYIVGDAAFPLSTNLMRPYAGHYLPLHKRIFNYRLSRGRRVAENTFGIVVSRWRILREPIIATLPTVEKICKAITDLHNWIMSNKNKSSKYFYGDFVDQEDPHGSIIPGEWRQDQKNNQNHLHRVGSNMYGKNAEEVRDSLALYFCSEGAVSFQWNK